MIYPGEPDRDALVCGDERLTFAELHERVDAEARRLESLDSGVVILDARGDPATVVQFMALLQLGKPAAMFSAPGSSMRSRFDARCWERPSTSTRGVTSS